MMAMDEYGTRRVKSWLKNAVEPALRQLGRVVQQFSQAIYTSHKVMNIVMTDEIANQKQIEINIPVYDDAGYLVEKHNDYNSAKFDVRVVAGSTLPVNRWAYLDELKGLYQMGIVDDIAVLGETDIRNKEDIAKRKSIYMDMKSQIEGLSNQLKERDGTIETLSRQLVQAGIKGKVMQAGVEVDKKKNEMKTIIDREANESKTEQAFYKRRIKERAELEGKNLALDIKSFKNNLENGNKN
jgi:hypothetical protein